ncbi:MAG: hypothetical protein AMXMBFR78_38130 [Rubrivivax sp.]
MHELLAIFHCLQRQLLPACEEELGPLDATDRQFVAVVGALRFGPLLRPYDWCGNGAKPHPRVWLAHAFIAKSVYQFPTTAALIAALRSRPTLRRLCGWESAREVPSEPTFSRAFDAFARSELPQRLHAELITRHAGPKLVGHLSRDATAIEVAERQTHFPSPPPPKPRGKPGRPKQGEVRPAPPPKRLDLQVARPLAENLRELPRHCDIGFKRDAKGLHNSWRGYKLHLDCADGDVPVSAVLTSASLHDSQVAIPLAQMSAQRVTSLYDLMDGAYDAPQIERFSRQLGHVPIIAPNRRSGPPRELERARKERLHERGSCERVAGLLKQRYGGRWVRVRGAAKVMCHLMFGLIALSASALYARLC